MRILGLLLLTAAGFLVVSQAQDCSQCSALDSQFSQCSGTNGTLTCLSQICSQSFLNEYATCTKCYGQNTQQISQESSEMDMIISSCGTLGYGGNLCNPLNPNSACAEYPSGATTATAAYATPSSVPTSINNNNNNNSSSSNNSNNNNSNNSNGGGSSANVGVIVGAAVGGVVVIAGAAFLGFKLAKRKPPPTLHTRLESGPISTPYDYDPANPSGYPPIQNIHYNAQQAQPQEPMPAYGYSPYYPQQPLAQPQHLFSPYSPTGTPQEAGQTPPSTIPSPFAPDSGKDRNIFTTALVPLEESNKNVAPLASNDVKQPLQPSIAAAGDNANSELKSQPPNSYGSTYKPDEN